MEFSLKSHDDVIVGAGSAGSVLPARLSEDGSRKVLVLEAGRCYHQQDFPPGLTDPCVLAGDDRHDWGYATEPGRIGYPIQLRRAKVLGGSSVTNAGVAIRPRPTDFARRQTKASWGGHLKMSCQRSSDWKTHPPEMSAGMAVPGRFQFVSPRSTLSHPLVAPSWRAPSGSSCVFLTISTAPNNTASAPSRGTCLTESVGTLPERT